MSVWGGYPIWNGINGGLLGQTRRARPTKRRVTRELSARVLARDQFQCRYCGGEADLAIDHVVPERFGGAAEYANLVTACRSCNSSKGIRLEAPLDWCGWNGWELLP